MFSAAVAAVNLETGFWVEQRRQLEANERRSSWGYDLKLLSAHECGLLGALVTGRAKGCLCHQSLFT